MGLRPLRLAGLILLAGCSDAGDPTAADPKRLYQDAFVTPPAEVEIVADGGTMVRGLDGWFKLLPGISGLKLRHADRFALRDCGEPLAWFAEVTGEAGLSVDRGGFVCRESVDPRFPFDNGRWLVQDRATGLAYYRIWKHFRKAGQ